MPHNVRRLAVPTICRVALVTLSEVTCQSRKIRRQESGTQTSISSDGPELLAPSVPGSSSTMAVSSGFSCGEAMANDLGEGEEKESEQASPESVWLPSREL